MPLPEAVRRLPLDAIAELVGQARVVAIGENNHYIREFGLLREQILRFLVTELDFRVLGFESGFAEGQLVDDWLHGGPGDVASVARSGFTFRFGDPAEIQDMLCWLRAHNANGGQVRFAGLDVPAAGGSPLPALRRVRDHLAAHAPAHTHLVDAAIEAVRPYAAANNSAALDRYATLSPAQRDAATSALARLLLRLDALPPSTEEVQVAKHHALGALLLDEHLRELLALGEAQRPALVTSSRDTYQAETVRLLGKRFGAEERIVLMMHNAHVQRVPMRLVPGTRAYCMGSYLAAELGEDYLAIGVTAHTGTTTDAVPNDQAPEGIEITSQAMAPPEADSVEQAIADSLPTDEPVLLDLRPARGCAGPASIRHVYTHADVDVLTAFDGLLCLPSISPSSFVLS